VMIALLAIGGISVLYRGCIGAVSGLYRW